MKTLIEIHVLQNYAPSNLNRDDTGAPKDTIFGGTRRARISSQCDKRAIRQFFKEKIRENGFSRDDLAIRTKRVYQAVADELSEKRDLAETMKKTKIALSYVKLKAVENDKTQYLLFLGHREIDALAHVIDEHWDQIVLETEGQQEVGGEVGNKKMGKSKKDIAKSAPKEIKEKVESLFNGGKAADLALFGRMLTDMPEKNQYAACQVAHAISTHSVEREFDYYTAVDDLKPEDTTGSDMIGTVEFNSSCFYRYAVVDWEKLVGNVERGENLQGDVELAEKTLRVFLEGFVMAEPTGKQNSFAAHNPPDFVAVTTCHDASPRNLANAFETAIFVRRGESLLRKSAEALVTKANVLQTAYPRKGETFVLNLLQVDASNFGEEMPSLMDVIDSTMEEVRR